MLHGKITADRLVKVERLQEQLRLCAVASSKLADEELNGWVPGTPRTEVSHRAEPLEKMTGTLTEFADQLEELYG